VDRVVENISVLMRAALRLNIPQLVSEQYPKGLGVTVASLAYLSDQPVAEKLSFSCMGDEEYVPRFKVLGRKQAVIVGMEAHVCVLQTAMDLRAEDVQVFIVADATSSRTPENHGLALQRLKGAGAEIVSTEMVVFEWLGKAGTPEFKELSALIK